METLQYVSSDKVARRIYDARLKTFNDRNSDMTIAREEGALEAKLETAKNFLKWG